MNILNNNFLLKCYLLVFQKTNKPKSLCTYFWAMVTTAILFIPLYSLQFLGRLIITIMDKENNIYNNYKLGTEKYVLTSIISVIFIIGLTGFTSWDSFLSPNEDY